MKQNARSAPADGSTRCVISPARRLSTRRALLGVLAIVDDATADAIEQHHMVDAVELVRWHLGESLRLCAASVTDPATQVADRVAQQNRGGDRRALRGRGQRHCKAGDCESQVSGVL